MTRWVLLLTQGIGLLPLAWVRAIGRVMGVLLYALVASRRRVVLVNLRLCFPQWADDQHRTCARQVFVHFAQSLSLIHI